MPQQKLVPNCFLFERTDNCLTVHILADLNDAAWGTYYGEVQEATRSKQYNGQPFTTIEIDLQQCRWADPTPLLVLAIDLLQFESQGGLVCLILPSVNLDDDTDRGDLDQQQRRRLLKFLAREGFLDLLSGRAAVADMSSTSKGSPPRPRVVRMGTRTFDQAMHDRCKALTADLAYNDSTCLPAELLYMESSKIRDGYSSREEVIHEWVEHRMQWAMDSAISARVPNWARHSIRYRLQLLLKETLDNVADHAYDVGGYAAVYVRFRRGLIDASPSLRQALAPAVAREDQDPSRLRVPLLFRRFIEDHSGFFEIFIADVGKGLCKTLGLRGGSLLNKSMLAVIANGDRRRRKETPGTEFGGLHLLAQLLQDNRDSLRVRDEDAWWGAILPFDPQSMSGAHHISAQANSAGLPAVRGLAWTVRLSWTVPTDMTVGGSASTYWYEHDSTNRAEHTLLSQFKVQEQLPTSTNAIHLVDMRCRDASVFEWSHAQSSRGETLLVLLPGRRWMKNEIQRRLATVVTKLEADYVSLNVVIGDIDPAEASTYIAALHNSVRLCEGALRTISSIALVTRRFRVCVLQRLSSDDHAPLRCSGSHGAAFLMSQSADEFSPHKSLHHYFRLLRYHDSFRFWNVVQTDLAGEQAFLQGAIVWARSRQGVSKTLDSYLDFAQTLTHPVCRLLYALSLERLYAMFPTRFCEFKPIDPLVDNSVVRAAVDAPAMSRVARPPKTILIGSVKVSGLTENAAIADRTNTEADPAVFHFLAHTSGAAIGGNTLLLWIPNVDSTPINAPPEDGWERIGRTAAIAKGGWKSLPMPRFRDEATSIYKCAPRTSYRQWQDSSLRLLRLGHWKYGGHHDLLTVNLLLACTPKLDDMRASAEDSPARFIFRRFFDIFGVSDADVLTTEGAHIRTALRLSNSRTDAAGSLVIYPSHAVTDYIVDRFLGFFADDRRRTDVRQRFIGVVPIRRTRTGSSQLISGLARQRIEAASETRPRPAVVIFDDAVITGRTHQELKQLLRSKGFRTIHTLALLDRQRLPSADYIGQEEHSHLCYWRLDVPTLGSDASCPLCFALSRLDSFQNALASKTAKERIDDWRRLWMARNPSTEWADAGLDSIPLRLARPFKKFGVAKDPRSGSYVQVGGDEQRIRVTSSAGLAAYVSEFHAMTSQDDLPTKILSEEPDLPLEAGVHLLASQLLLFGREFDYDLKGELAQKLLRLLLRSKTQNSHTAFAALTLLSLERELRISVLAQAVPDDVNMLTVANLDALLFLAHCRHSNVSLGVFDTEQVSRLLLGGKDLREAYSRLHWESTDAQGDFHAPPLARLSQGDREPIYLVKGADFSADQILAVINQIPAHRYRNTEAGGATDTIGRATAACIRLRELATQYRLDKRPPNERKEDFRAVQVAGRALASEAADLHSRLFAQLGLSDIHQGRQPAFVRKELSVALEEASLLVAREITSFSAIVLPHTENDFQRARNTLKESLTEAYVVWDSRVANAVTNILHNARHCKGHTITSPHGEPLHLQISIQYGTDRLRIVARNHLGGESLDRIHAETQANSSIADITDLGGGVTYESSVVGVVDTIITLPFAHALMTNAHSVGGNL